MCLTSKIVFVSVGPSFVIAAKKHSIKNVERSVGTVVVSLFMLQVSPIGNDSGGSPDNGTSLVY